MHPNCHEIAASWLAEFGTSLAARNIQCTANCIEPNGFLRDVLVFTWRNRTLRGTDAISAYLSDAFTRGVAVSQFSIDDRPGLAPITGPNSSTSCASAISAGFAFAVTGIGVGRGYFTLVHAEDSAEWKAVTVFMTLWDIYGHEEEGEEEGTYGGHTIPWSDVDAQRRAAVESDPHVLISKPALLSPLCINIV